MQAFLIFINMIKIINLLKEILTEAKQRGNLYHFTPFRSLENILLSKVLKPNNEEQISTSVRPNMSIRGFNKMLGQHIVRLTLDGDKISNKYKIRPFSYRGNEDLGEEQIITNGETFPFYPYLKRIDIFLNTENKKEINDQIKLLQTLNIPYKIYKGDPFINTPYEQPKDGSPENIYVDKIKKKYSQYELYFPNMKFKKISLPYLSSKKITVGISPEYPDHYLALGKLSQKERYKDKILNVKGEKINNIEVIPIPMYDDEEWRDKWKDTYDWEFFMDTLDDKPKFDERLVKDAYILIPKNEVD
jgi:hypothetical protein